MLEREREQVAAACRRLAAEGLVIGTPDRLHMVAVHDHDAVRPAGGGDAAHAALDLAAADAFAGSTPGRG